MTKNSQKISIDDIKNKLHKKYFRTECYLLGTFIEKYNIKNIDDVKIIKTKDYSYGLDKKAQLLKTKNNGVYRIYTFATI